MKPLFITGPAAFVRLLAFGVLSVVIMTVDHRAGHLESLRGALSTLIYPLQVAVDLPIKASTWVAENAKSRNDLLSENRDLREKHFTIQSKLRKLAQMESENQRLRGLLASSAKVDERVLIAELMSVDMDPFSRRIVLNKGTHHGVHQGQAMVDSTGIMGQVVHAGPFSSNALLITDPSHALPVQVHRSGLLAVAVGSGPDKLQLSHVRNNADVKVGDLLVTSGLGGKFPAGYPVGRVTSVERDQGREFAAVDVSPSARLERNREVLLVWPPQKVPSASDARTNSADGEQGQEEAQRSKSKRPAPPSSAPDLPPFTRANDAVAVDAQTAER